MIPSSSAPSLHRRDDLRSQPAVVAEHRLERGILGRHGAVRLDDLLGARQDRLDHRLALKRHLAVADQAAGAGRARLVHDREVLAGDLEAQRAAVDVDLFAQRRDDGVEGGRAQQKNSGRGRSSRECQTLEGRRVRVAAANARARGEAMPFADVDDVRLYYEFTGPEDAPLILQFGGSLFGRQNFDAVNDGFRENFRLLSFDASGYGRSTQPLTEYSIENWAREGAGLLDALGIERALTHGTSMGGMIALAFTAHVSREDDRLVRRLRDGPLRHLPADHVPQLAPAVRGAPARRLLRPADDPGGRRGLPRGEPRRLRQRQADRRDELARTPCGRPAWRWSGWTSSRWSIRSRARSCSPTARATS